MTRKSCVCIFLLFILPFICGLRERIFQRFGDKKTWREAQSFCRQKYTDLITIRNEEESQTLLEYEGWIGLYQDNDRSPWKWSSGDEMATFFKWRATNPYSGQNCSYKRSFLNWEDDICTVARSYICHNETLVLVNENKTWEEALEHCRSLKDGQIYDLATLITPDDHDYARERAQKATSDEVWTGLRYLGGEWFWVGGEPVEYKDIPSCPAAKCGVLEKDSKTSFGLRDCSQRRNFFCYKKKN